MKERRKNCGNRWYDINRGAFVIAYSVTAMLGFIFGFIVAKIF